MAWPDAVRGAVAAGARRILSIAAGVTLGALDAAAGPGVAVVRAMPNTPALVGLGAAAIAGGATASDGDLAWAEAILGSVGIVERLDEAALDAFTGVAGSGPAYVFLFAEALTDAAIAEGIDADVAERVVAQLLLGASTLLDRDRDAGAAATQRHVAGRDHRRRARTIRRARSASDRRGRRRGRHRAQPRARLTQPARSCQLQRIFVWPFSHREIRRIVVVVETRSSVASW